MSYKLFSRTRALYFLGWQQIKRNQVKSNFIFLRIGKNPMKFGKNQSRVENQQKATRKKIHDFWVFFLIFLLTWIQRNELETSCTEDPNILKRKLEGWLKSGLRTSYLRSDKVPNCFRRHLITGWLYIHPLTEFQEYMSIFNLFANNSG